MRRRKLAALDASQLVFPFCRQKRRLQLFGKDRDERYARLHRHKADGFSALFPLHKAARHELLDHGGACRGRADALALRVLGHILTARRLHCMKQRVLTVCRRPLCFALCDLAGRRGQRCTLDEIGQRFVHLLFEIGFPACIQNGLSLRGEDTPAAGDLGNRVRADRFAADGD